MNEPKLCLGPMSKNVVDAAIEFAEDRKISLGLIPSRRQIDHQGGYVNWWTTKKFSKYVRERSSRLWLIRDHGGGGQGATKDWGFDSLAEDSLHFDAIHLDPWRFNNFNEALEQTANYLKFCFRQNPNLWFEVGTEEAIQPYSPEQLAELLDYLENNLSLEEFSQIKYVVIQSGTSIKDGANTGSYSAEKLTQMLWVAQSYKLLSKEHNGDFLSANLIREKFAKGLDSINIAPELGQIETQVYLNLIADSKKPYLFDLFYHLAHTSGKWKKWLSSPKSSEEIIKAAGHYVFSDPKFQVIVNYFQAEDLIKLKIKQRIGEILS